MRNIIMGIGFLLSCSVFSQTVIINFPPDSSVVGAYGANIHYYGKEPNRVSPFSAGSNQAVCAGDTIWLYGNSGDYSNVEWTVTGTGTFSDKNNDTTYYIPSLADQDSAYLDFTLAVVGGGEDTSQWILSNGLWNDTGIWVDTETWNDSAPMAYLNENNDLITLNWWNDEKYR